MNDPSSETATATPRGGRPASVRLPRWASAAAPTLLALDLLARRPAEERNDHPASCVEAP
jgi:hypothetical protein